MAELLLDFDLLDRMVRAVEKVRNRLIRACKALEQAKIPYAVVGGNAVAAWVSTIDEAAVRNTQDVDILLNRSDLEAAKDALAGEGFIFRHVKGIDMFLDGPGAKARDAVHVVFADERVRPDDLASAPSVALAIQMTDGRFVNLEALVTMKLTSYRVKDRMHLLDMLEVGLIDESWLIKLPDALAGRLKALIDDPNG